MQCFVNSDWKYVTEWTPCSVSCGMGMKSRSKACTNGTVIVALSECGGKSDTGDSTITETLACRVREFCGGKSIIFTYLFEEE